MNWQQQIVNKEEVPQNLFYVYIQSGKAFHSADKNVFGPTEKVIGFESLKQANYFVCNYKSGRLHFTDSMLEEDYPFYVFDICPGGYYCDKLQMTKK